MANKVLKLDLQRDYKRFLYFVDGYGNVCRKPKEGGVDEVLVKAAIQRDHDYLYFIDKEGDVSRTERAATLKRGRGVTQGG